MTKFTGKERELEIAYHRYQKELECSCAGECRETWREVVQKFLELCILTGQYVPPKKRFKFKKCF